jgi:2-C-methyl-D-erythritol 2,4-cyclodiphosphate synthase
MSGHRVGCGFDAHRLVEGRPLMLGCVQVPHVCGLEGHSDGDCLTHAICDALLGAAGEGDMGRHFPSTDPLWKGTRSLAFLEEVARIVAAAGFALENVDATVIAEAPPLSPYLEAMRQALSSALGAPASAISVKAKSADGLGAIGRGEGIAAQATALLRPVR